MLPLVPLVYLLYLFLESLVRLLPDCCVSLRVRVTFRVCSSSSYFKMGEGEGEHTLNVTLTLKLTQQSSNKQTKEIPEVNTVNRLKGLKKA